MANVALREASWHLPSVFLRIACCIAFISIPYALGEAGNSPTKIEIFSLIVGFPHLLAIVSPQTRAKFVVGTAIGASLVLLMGFTINSFISLIRLFPVAGNSRPWFGGMAAHALMLVAGLAARRSLPEHEKPRNWTVLSGCLYSLVSIPVIQLISSFFRWNVK